MKGLDNDLRCWSEDDLREVSFTDYCEDTWHWNKHEDRRQWGLYPCSSTQEDDSCRQGAQFVTNTALWKLSAIKGDVTSHLFIDLLELKNLEDIWAGFLSVTREWVTHVFFLALASLLTLWMLARVDDDSEQHDVCVLTFCCFRFVVRCTNWTNVNLRISSSLIENKSSKPRQTDAQSN